MDDTSDRREEAQRIRDMVQDPCARVVLSAEAALPEELLEPVGGDDLSRMIEEIIRSAR